MGQLEEMSVFVRIVDAGGIGKAAEQLGMAKSGISRRLVALENRLGVTLINRTTRSTSLTGAGRQFYEAAVKLIGDVSELNALTSDAETSLEGPLRLAAPLSFGLCHLSRAIDVFSGEHPGLTFNIDFSDRHVDLVEKGMDLAIRIADLKDSSLRARRICPIQLVLCASPGYLQTHGIPLKPDDLKDHQVLSYDIGGGTALKLGDGQGNEQQVHVASRMVANNGDFLRDMALTGHGIVLLPTFIVWQSLASGELVSILEAYTPTPLSAWAVYPQTRYLSHRARLFIDFLVERFGDNPYWDDF
jgi:DNA-binding transcriptional LysR family regulator